MILSKKISEVKESGTTRFTALIEELRKQGKEIIDFAVGEPDFETDREIKEAVKKALDKNKTKYSNVSGIADLKEKISIKLKKERISYNKEDIIISNGSKQALYDIFQAICNPRDEVIIPRPYWVSFAEQTKLADAKPVFVNTICHQLSIEDIKNAVSKKTKAIIINSPNNPTGAVYNKKDLKAIADLALDNNFFIISDEAYLDLIYDGLSNSSIASLNEETKKRTILVRSFSKTFSMTGFRIGYTAADKEIINCMNKLQSHITGNVCTFAQYGAIAALDIDKKIIEKRRNIFEKRRNLAYSLAKKLFECIKPQGAFYLFPKIEEYLKENIKTSEDFAAYLLEKANVATVPGNVFGFDSNIRISYAVSEDDIKKGFERMDDAL